MTRPWLPRGRTGSTHPLERGGSFGELDVVEGPDHCEDLAHDVLLGHHAAARIAEVEIPPNTGDFRLMSRRVVTEVLRLKESHGFLRGMAIPQPPGAAVTTRGA